MLKLTRLGRIPAQYVYRRIHTTAVIKNSNVEPTAAKLLNDKSNVGRLRSSKLKRSRSLAALPESFLLSNYQRHESLGKLPDRYSKFIPEHTWKELEYATLFGLSPKGKMSTFTHTDHLSIHVPDPGASFIQDYIVRQLVMSAKANVLTFDPQDFIFLAQHSFSRDAALLIPMLSSRDPNANALLALNQHTEEDIEDKSKEDVIGRGKPDTGVELVKKESEEFESEDEDEDESIEDNKVKLQINSKTIDINLQEILSDDNKFGDVSKLLVSQIAVKYTHMFKKFLTGTPKEEAKIIYLRDYNGMQDTFNRIMLKFLTKAIEESKQSGHRVMMITSQSLKYLSDDEDLPLISNMRNMTIIPSIKTEEEFKEWKDIMKEDESRRIREINSKQLIAAYTQKNVLEIKDERKGDLLNQLLTIDIPNLSKSIWSSSEVDRQVSIAIGHALEGNKIKLDIEDFKAGNDLIENNIKLENQSFYKKLLNSTQLVKLDKEGSVDIDYLKRVCNEYERKLLSRIVDPFKVQGSFKDVRAPSDTIDTLQSLISLPLIRPDLFQKGILKKNFIPGVLLFGPPGTGKTMLAKAVAKDSGSRMLDIQASDVYDMYVGQGEKNVKAIFSLARKLSPCVVFIDEVDSLMIKRGSDYSSKSHREIINQFMVEWDGLSSNNQGVIVMAATNRPFDLDDAVLRRMPRRILVDLPKEEDRAEILKILLQDENHNVSFNEIAKLTEHYSGSDLKNVCVTAALKAVQQEIRTNTKQILNIEHFKEAIKMIPPSSSEDMDTVMEIRKWDSKFGDGKKKKKSIIGFS